MNKGGRKGGMALRLGLLLLAALVLWTAGGGSGVYSAVPAGPVGSGGMGAGDPDVVNLVASQDTHIQRYAPSDNFCGSNRLWVGWKQSYRALLAGTYVPYKMLGVNFMVMALIFVGGVAFFRHRSQQLVDLL